MPLNFAAFSWPSVLLVVLVVAVVAWFKRRRHMPAAPQDNPIAGEPGVTPPPQHSLAEDGEPAGTRAPALNGLASWGYQLQNLDPAVAADSPFDMLVIDYALGGGDDTALTPAELDLLKRKPDGGRRVVLSYLSLGEAESYRSYWQTSWSPGQPRWLAAENPDWPENYAVHFWDPDWQRLIFGGPNAYLDKIIAQGFDGVFCDKCDVYEDLDDDSNAPGRSLAQMEAAMVGFLADLSAYAEARRPGFYVVMQNAETLLGHEKLRRAIDGVAKEELIYGQGGGERRNKDDDFVYSRRHLDLAKADGMPVFVVEYLANRDKIREARRIAGQLGYVLAISDKDRELDRLDFDDLIA